MTPSKIFLCFCLSFIVGIAISSFFIVPQPALLVFLISGLALVSFFLVKRKLAILGVCLILLSVGIWRHQNYEFRIMNSELRNYNDREEAITLIGTVIKEPDIRETNIKLLIETEKIELPEDSSFSIQEKVLVTTSRYPEYDYGDKLKITGQLKTPPVFEDFNYQDYLAKQGILSVIYWPKIELLKRKNYKGVGPAIYARILDFKDKLRKVIEENLSPPQSSILGAVILGDKRKMPEKLREKLNVAGLRHLTAISGMHITILGLILLEVFLGLGLWRRQALYLSLASLFLFIVMVGAPSSAVRAGIMGGLLIIGRSLGRLSESSRAIVFAGAGILAFNPLLLKSDVGFQLSFLATLGIIYLMSNFQTLFKKVPDNFLGFLRLRSIIAMTLAAQIFTLPILIYNFGYFSLVSPLSNILIVPIFPLLLVGGFLFVLGGALWPLLGRVFSWPCWLFLTFILKIIDFLSKTSWAAIYLKISWFWLLIAYLALAWLAWFLNRRQKFKFLNY